MEKEIIGERLETHKYLYKFSCIMAVYNVEAYIEKAIESVIQQDIGFEEHVQLILVDCSFSDGNGAIYDSYVAQYPNNIVVIHRPGSGIFSARNTGLELAIGEYITFLAPTATITSNVFRAVSVCFETANITLGAVSVPVKFKGLYSKTLKLNTHKADNLILNMHTNALVRFPTISGLFYPRKLLIEKCFDETMCALSDIKWNYEILLTTPCVGATKTGACTIHTHSMAKTIYPIECSMYDKWDLKKFLKTAFYLCSMYQNSIGYIPKALQEMLMYIFQHFLMNPAKPSISDDNWDHINECSQLLNFINDSIILHQKNLHREYKLHALELKYSAKAKVISNGSDLQISVRGNHVNWFSHTPLRITVLKKLGSYLQICGMETYYTSAKGVHKIIAKVNHIEYVCELLEDQEIVFSMGTAIANRLHFKALLPLDGLSDMAQIEFYHSYNGTLIKKKTVKYSNYSVCVNPTYRNSYSQLGEWLLKIRSDSTIVIYKNTKKKHFKFEYKFLMELLKTKRKSDKKAFFVRVMYHVLNTLKKTPIWLISDRILVANDNGEAFFRFMQQNKEPNVNTYFVIHPDSIDYQRMSEVGKMLPYLSYKHKMIHLLSDVIVSSQAGGHVQNPFFNYSAPYADIIAAKEFVFLQHGVIKDDLSSWLKKTKKDMCGFVTSAYGEYQSILDAEYHYTKDEVWLTGLPRFDRLYTEPKRFITIMPTWRKYLTADYDALTGIWNLRSDFKEHVFYQFYNNLLNHPVLLETCKKYNYKLQFFPHPNLAPFVNLFDINGFVEVPDRDKAYRDIYAESNLVLTDYSSAVFDFAYLRKPLMYAHFDHIEFFAGEHVYTKGYFEYERDGLGEVCYDLETTVDTIIEYIKNDCQLKDKYRQRIDNFFAFNDQNNCQRVFEKIISKTNAE